jgi:hypothetical protein
VAIDRHHGMPNENSRTTEAVFTPMPLTAVNQARAPSADMSPREPEAAAARFVDRSQRGLMPRALPFGRPPGR